MWYAIMDQLYPIHKCSTQLWPSCTQYRNVVRNYGPAVAAVPNHDDWRCWQPERTNEEHWSRSCDQQAKIVSRGAAKWYSSSSSGVVLRRPILMVYSSQTETETVITPNLINSITTLNLEFLGFPPFVQHGQRKLSSIIKRKGGRRQLLKRNGGGYRRVMSCTLVVWDKAKLGEGRIEAPSKTEGWGLRWVMSFTL